MSSEIQTLRQPLIDKVNNLILDKCLWIGSESLFPETSFGHSDGGLEFDDLDYLDMMIAVDKAFGIDILGTEWDTVQTLADLYNLIEAHLDANQQEDNYANPCRK